MENQEVRVRFAPSPTGGLHLGGVRTALYNYLFARKNKGKMILRIEDTDRTRFVEGAEAYIKESLEWCGIELDESPWDGGDFAPYRQSERKPMYMEYAQRLVDQGKAYYAFDTAEELEAMRERLKAARVVAPQYNVITRMTMKNSLTLPQDEVKKRLESGEPYVIRIKVPRKEQIRFNDLVRGWVTVQSASIDDKVLMKSDGMPTYHLANVVDDYLMKISHVIRGEEWLPSAPLHVLLYQYFGWDTPDFAHLPLILKPNGNGKLSKRDGDKLGFSVFPLQWADPSNPDKSSTGYREQGYLSEAFVNFLAFLGWNPGKGSQKEIFTKAELIEEFSIERIGKSGAKFDIEKVKWYNQQYLRNLPNAELAEFLKADLQKHQIEESQDRIEQVCELMKERITFGNELWQESQYFFMTPTQYEEKVIKKKWNQQAVNVLTEFRLELEKLADFSGTNAKQTLYDVTQNQGIKMGKVMQAVRVAITGVGSGADLTAIIEWLGKDEVIARIDVALETLKDRVKA